MPRSNTRKYKNLMKKGRKTKRGGEGSSYKPVGVAARVKALQGEFTKKKSLRRSEGPKNKGYSQLLAEERKNLKQTLNPKKNSPRLSAVSLEKPFRAASLKKSSSLSAASLEKKASPPRIASLEKLPASPPRASPPPALPAPASPLRASPPRASPPRASPPRASPLRASQKTGAPRKLTRGRVKPVPVLPEYAAAVAAVEELDLFLNELDLSDESATVINNEIVEEAEKVEAQLPPDVKADFEKMVVEASADVKEVIRNSPNKDAKKNKEYIIQIWFRKLKEFIRNKLKRKANSGKKTVKAPVRGLGSRGSVRENPIRQSSQSNRSSQSNISVKQLAEEVVETASLDDLGNILEKYGVNPSKEFTDELTKLKNEQVRVQTELNNLVEENQQNERKLLIKALRNYIKEKVDKLQREGEYILLEPEESGNVGESYKKSIKKPKINEEKFIRELDKAYEIYLKQLEAESNSGYLEILPN